MKLEPQGAIKAAKEWLTNHLSEEGVTNIGLEEVRMNDGVWEITLGFSRRWDVAGLSILTSSLSARTYKMIRIDPKDNAVIEMRNREAA